MLPVYQLTLRQLSGKWRLAIMTVLAALPVIIVLIMLQADTAGSVAGFEKSVLAAMLAGAISPLAVLAIGSAAFANEVEDRTLANLTLSPIPRWQIVLPKLLATVTIAAPFIAMSAGVTAYLAYLGDVRAVTSVVVSAVVGVLLYSSVFVYLGLVSTQAIGIGLVYIVLWEGFIANFINGVRMLSIRHYSVALIHGLDPRRFAVGQHAQLSTVLIVAAVVFGGFTWLAIRRLRRMDVP